MPRRGKQESLIGAAVAGRTIRGLAARYEGVRCECADQECGCLGHCSALAFYQWGSVDEGEWTYLCYRCALHFREVDAAWYLAWRRESSPDQPKQKGDGR